MLVARFGPSTAWLGREIIWDVDHFILVGHGAIPAAGVLDYDRRGQLVWAQPQYRAWVYQVDLWENGGRSSLQPAAASGASGGEAAARRRFPVWAIVVIVVTLVCLVLAVVVAALVPSLISHSAKALAFDMVVRSGVHTIQAGIESYAADHDGQFPAPGEVNAVGLSRYISVWPQNPYTDLPMVDGGGVGNFRYDVSGGGGAYRLIGYGRDGTVVIELAGGSSASV